MRYCKVVISRDAPAIKDAMWAKPIEGGFALYLLEGGKWKPLKVVDDNETSYVSDDTIQDTKAELIGSVQDEKTANTINGAKAYANDIASSIGSEIVGDPTDAASNMTLYGLKNYIDAQIESVS